MVKLFLKLNNVLRHLENVVAGSIESIVVIFLLGRIECHYCFCAKINTMGFLSPSTYVYV